jgi:YjbE family integral membrane protein
MDFSGLGHITFNAQFCFGFLSIMFINIILSGDNAVVIAMAVRSLGKKQRIQGILWGTVAAVVLRIVLTFFTVKLLEIHFLKFVGGVLITWIAIKLFLDSGDDGENQKEIKTLGKAIVTILIADLVMSTDNVLGVAAACKGDINLLLIGLGTSIPIVIFAANMLSKLMDRFPIILVLGAAVLGRVGGEMVMGDPVVQNFLGHPAQWVEYVVQAIFAIGVVVVGKWLLKRKEAKAALSETNSTAS